MGPPESFELSENAASSEATLKHIGDIGDVPVPAVTNYFPTG